MLSPSARASLIRLSTRPHDVHEHRRQHGHPHHGEDHPPTEGPLEPIKAGIEAIDGRLDPIQISPCYTRAIFWLGGFPLPRSRFLPMVHASTAVQPWSVCAMEACAHRSLMMAMMATRAINRWQREDIPSPTSSGQGARVCPGAAQSPQVARYWGASTASSKSPLSRRSNTRR
jgi:hypothetical protein